jgi:hypothetical protein
LSSLNSIHDGSIAAKPFEHQSGKIAGTPEHQHGRVHGREHHHARQIDGSSEASEENAIVAEIANLVASLGSLSAQAQRQPMSPPTLPQTPSGQAYRPQLTDYTQLGGDVE